MGDFVVEQVSNLHPKWLRLKRERPKSKTPSEHLFPKDGLRSSLPSLADDCHGTSRCCTAFLERCIPGPVCELVPVGARPVMAVTLLTAEVAQAPPVSRPPPPPHQCLDPGPLEVVSIGAPTCQPPHGSTLRTVMAVLDKGLPLPLPAPPPRQDPPPPARAGVAGCRRAPGSTPRSAVAAQEELPVNQSNVQQHRSRRQAAAWLGASGSHLLLGSIPQIAATAQTPTRMRAPRRLSQAMELAWAGASGCRWLPVNIHQNAVGAPLRARLVRRHRHRPASNVQTTASGCRAAPG